MMKKSLFTALIICSFFFVAQAQGYKTAVGLRFGYPTSVSLKHFLNEKGAGEAFAGLQGYGYGRDIVLGATYQHHSPIESVDGLQWYFGGGAAVSFSSYKTGFSGSSTGIGILGIIGLDYKFEDYPVNLSLDWMPLFALRRNDYRDNFGYDYIALSARYVFNEGGGK